jgi:hypothetical protein
MRPIVRLTIAAFVAAPRLIGAQQPTPAAQTPPINIVTRVVRASLRGIVLTDAERANLKTVQATYRPQFQSLATEMQPIRLALRDARQKRDTAVAHAARKALREKRRAGVGVLQSSLREMRTKLTSEQQTQFDANVVRVRVLVRRWAMGTGN